MNAIGQLIEESLPDRLSQYVDVLAHHYGRTGRHGQAANLVPGRR